MRDFPYFFYFKSVKQGNSKRTIIEVFRKKYFILKKKGSGEGEIDIK